MQHFKKHIKAVAALLLIVLCSFSAKSQAIELKDYCIVGYYASSPTATFKTPFIFNFGENNTFQYLEVDGRLHEGKYTVTNGNIKFELIGGEYNYELKGETVTPRGNRTYARLEKKIFGNRLKSNRYTGILYKQQSSLAVRTSYQFIGAKFSITNEKGTVVPYTEYTLVGNMAGYAVGGIKSSIKRSIFVLYGTQLVVMNIYRNESEGATFGILDQVNTK
ncbi:hypothetical protein [Terrimonas ferruginea]|uniref:hypothetical protein n=1 Tax=Terrimonas ferruginea TaxID=249 RepID=UPI000422DD22|nr:hypothetical protein [Terrimonas ferruginea]